MEELIEYAEVRWADIDANFHVLHSKYYDYCASARMSVLQKRGVTMEAVQQYQIGPILLREECVFKREIKFGDKLQIKIKLKSHDENFKKWSFINEIWKNEDTLAAIITVDGAWMDVVKRKIVEPPEVFKDAYRNLPKAEN